MIGIGVEMESLNDGEFGLDEPEVSEFGFFFERGAGSAISFIAGVASKKPRS